ncbi:YidH family protein [Sulfurimonas sp.]
MQSKKEIDPKDLMAVERATTALIGTAISLIVLGFVIEKFELFLHVIASEIKDKPYEKIPQLTHIAFYNYFGIIIVSAGVVLALYTYRYYVSWIKHLENNEINTDKNIYFVLSVFVAIIGIVLILSMLIL